MGAELSWLMQECWRALATLGAPVFGALFALGLLMGLLQAATQINDAAVGFVPRLFFAGALCALLGPWVVERLALLVRGALERLAQGG